MKGTIKIDELRSPRIASASSLNRISIASYFVQSARSAPDLGLKAVGYCSALEALFANGENTEIAHKLSERVAKFLETELEKRQKTYHIMKQVYGIRSKVVHGDTFKPTKVKDLDEILTQTDQICRSIITYALTTSNKENIFEKSKEELNKYFIELSLK